MGLLQSARFVIPAQSFPRRRALDARESGHDDTVAAGAPHLTLHQIDEQTNF